MLKACGLGRRKPGSEDWLLRGVCIEVRPGDRLALTGPSGSGKTVLLRALAHLDPHDEGSIEWEGRSLRGEAIPAYRKRSSICTNDLHYSREPSRITSSIPSL